MASHDPRLGDRPDLPSSQHQQMQGRTQARGESESEREHMPVEARTPEEARRAARAIHAGRDQPAGMGLGNAAQPGAADEASAHSGQDDAEAGARTRVGTETGARAGTPARQVERTTPPSEAAGKPPTK